MRYPNAIFYYTLNISFLAQLCWTVVAALISLVLVVYTPWLGHNPIIFVIPAILATWIFEGTGLFICLFVLLCLSGLNYIMQMGFVWPPASHLLVWSIDTFICILIGLIVNALRAILLVTLQAKEIAESKYEEQCRVAEVKDEFLQKVNHELRTPLTALYGYLELLLEHGEQLDTEIRTTFLQHAMQGCDELQLLVNNVLDTMSNEKDRPSPYTEQLPVRDILFEVLERFDPKSVQEHSIYVDVPDYIVVQGNAQYLRQILRNLLANAFKYAPAHTPITVSAALNGMVVHPLHAAPEICISVRDVGPGIPEDEMPLLFKQFVRLRRETSGRVGGSGLGLFLSKQFVEAMGGHIWVESAGIEGQGSCFSFTLPCVIRPKVQAKTSPDDFTQFNSSVSLPS
ncbi:ATP-binding protein [Dictyobacter arantiisoli]|uniref:histidine kinase n=1 Tax=Dictyobacter arantiisoli TaxID=2014874 RepID=A0A5A5T7A6_9CHLR|nr:ATP-binding protein [Dictyobacter arantiisoli]GCF06839.1 hypothetical protein KDI_04030 [Dictyobacter arantiisoli]